MEVNRVLEMLMCMLCNMITARFCRVCKEVKFYYFFGEWRFNSKEKAVLEKPGDLRKQENLKTRRY